jgi:hypothetical protein
MSLLNNAVEITVLQLPKFRAEATDLIGAQGIEALAAYSPITRMLGM